MQNYSQWVLATEVIQRDICSFAFLAIDPLQKACEQIVNFSVENERRYSLLNWPNQYHGVAGHT